MKSMRKEIIGQAMLTARQKSLALCVALVAGIGFAQETTPAAKREAPARSPAEALSTDKEKLSYALGLNVGLSAQKQIKRGSLDVDTALFIQAVKDGLSGHEPLLTIEQADTILVSKRTEMRQEQEQARNELAAKNLKEEEMFLAKHRTEAGVVSLESGLQYQVLKAGEGEKPTADDTVRCQYRGTLLDGTEFDSTAKRGLPANLPLKQLIPGWREALELMSVGSRWKIVIPSVLAYGERGGGPIGPNAALVFEVELLGINEAVPKTAVTADPAKPTEATGVLNAGNQDGDQTLAKARKGDAARGQIGQ